MQNSILKYSRARYCNHTLGVLFWNILGTHCVWYDTVSASLLSVQPHTGDNALTLASFGDVMEQSVPLTSSKQKIMTTPTKHCGIKLKPVYWVRG